MSYLTKQSKWTKPLKNELVSQSSTFQYFKITMKNIKQTLTPMLFDSEVLTTEIEWIYIAQKTFYERIMVEPTTKLQLW